MYAILRIKTSVNGAVFIGEPTGGALDCYGDLADLTLPNSQMLMYYSYKHFEISKDFAKIGVTVERTDTFLPDVFIEMTIEDYRNGFDAVLDYALHN